MITIEEILAISENDRVLQRLRHLLKEGAATAFVGSGASAPLFPIWRELLKNLIDLGASYGARDETLIFWRQKIDDPLLVAEQIRRHVGEAVYRQFLYETFKDRVSDDGLSFTAVHANLMQLPFKAYVTTNYDQAILEARRIFNPDLEDTGFTWQESERLPSWTKHKAPVLFAHGHFYSPSSIVLDLSSYKRAYSEGPYRRLFENLWTQENLIFVGFGFSDPMLKWIISQVVNQFIVPTGEKPRHIAILPLSEDQRYTREMRQEMEVVYHADALFFPVRANDYSGLAVILEHLATSQVVLNPSKPILRTVPVRFSHETSEDDYFTGRQSVLSRLDGWARDLSVRVVAITAVGGSGKTALLSYWLRSGRPAANRHCDGIFFWSFYQDRDPERFLRALADFRNELPEPKHLVISLDGLEVIQESPGTIAYGRLLDLEVARFLAVHCRARDGNLVMLTSRFPFPDLMPYLGGQLRPLALPPLEAFEGAELLQKLGVNGSQEDRELVTRKLYGHPLALRIYAGASTSGDPTRLLEQASLSASDPLQAKMIRLLQFYERLLPEDQLQALTLVALFRMPVNERILATLWKGPSSLLHALAGLKSEYLITSDPGYSCHPILRDYFLSRIANDRFTAVEAANIMTKSPGFKRKKVERLQLEANAVELLIAAGDLRAAEELFAGGDHFVGVAPHLGLELSLRFIQEEERLNGSRPKFSPESHEEIRLEATARVKEGRFLRRGIGSYLHTAALCATEAGEPEIALRLFGNISWRSRGDWLWEGKYFPLETGYLKISLGLLEEAHQEFRRALTAGKLERDWNEIYEDTCATGYIASLRGDLDRATRLFSRANHIYNTSHISTYQSQKFHGLNLLHWAEHLIRTGDFELARTITEKNRKSASWENRVNLVARCDWALGWIDICQSKLADAQERLTSARAIFERGHVIYDLARTYLCEALYYQAIRDLENAVASCDRALLLASPRNYRLIHADALRFRSQFLADTDPNRSRDDMEAAVQVANFCGYRFSY